MYQHLLIGMYARWHSSSAHHAVLPSCPMHACSSSSRPTAELQGGALLPA
ncbi:hypothetical protein UQW22_04490 [Isoptericola halotolerans]